MAEIAQEKKTSEVGVDVFCTQEKVVVGRYEGNAGTVTLEAVRKNFSPATDEYRFPHVAGKDKTRTLMENSQALCPKCRGALMLVPTGGDPVKDGVYLVPGQIKLQKPEEPKPEG